MDSVIAGASPVIHPMAKKYQKPSKPCTRKRRNMQRLDKPTATTKTGRRTRYVRPPEPHNLDEIEKETSNS